MHQHTVTIRLHIRSTGSCVGVLPIEFRGNVLKNHGGHCPPLRQSPAWVPRHAEVVEKRLHIPPPLSAHDGISSQSDDPGFSSNLPQSCIVHPLTLLLSSVSGLPFLLSRLLEATALFSSDSPRCADSRGIFSLFSVCAFPV
jgi:hypothetical protein